MFSRQGRRRPGTRADAESNLPGFGLYDTTGTTEDWSFWSTGGLGFTFEIGPSEFHPPYETGVVAEYLGLPPAEGAGKGGNREAYYEMLEATADTALHSVLTGSAPAGSTLSLRKTFQTATSPVCRDVFCTDIGDPLLFQDTLESGAIVAQSAAFGDATEDATLIDPPAGTYRAIVVNHDQIDRTPDDWSGEVRFQSPTPEVIGTEEAWTFSCRTPSGDVATREVIVDRGQSADLGRACEAAAKRR